ncbi:hypothetical protein HRbin36_00104 [bacterium HR36]|nr:hypothetical protein HRbin36_00104 [bacterium HR36]
MAAVVRIDTETFWEKYLPPLWPPIWPPLWPPVWRPLPAEQQGGVNLQTQRLPNALLGSNGLRGINSDLVELNGDEQLVEEPRESSLRYRELAEGWIPLGEKKLETGLAKYNSALWWEQWQLVAGESDK